MAGARCIAPLWLALAASYEGQVHAVQHGKGRAPALVVHWTSRWRLMAAQP